jgi:Ca2+-binding EF-hand superfamily protein
MTLRHICPALLLSGLAGLLAITPPGQGAAPPSAKRVRVVAVAVPPVPVAAPSVPGIAPAGKGMRDVQDVVFFADSRPVLVRLRIRIGGKPLHDVWQAYIDKVFRYLDSNGDGSLDRKEAQRVPPVQTLFNTGFFFGGGAPSFAQLDTNRDGKISKAELAAYYRNNGASPFQFSYGGGQNVASPVPLNFGGGMGGGGVSADALNKRLFELLDTNKDGKLSLKELKAGIKALSKLDADDDEMLTADELMGNARSSSSDAGAVVAFSYPAMPVARSGGPLHVVTSRRADAGLARQLIQRYGRRDKKPPARKLTAKMLGLDREAFKRLDVDGDGELDAEELARFALRKPDLELQVDLGRRGRPPAVKLLTRSGKAAGLAASVKATSRGPVLSLGNTRLEFATPPSPRGYAFAFNVRQEYLARFKAADRDNNGYLDEKEAMASPFFRGVFKLMDADGDGKLFKKEMLAYLDKMKELSDGATASIVSLQLSDQGQGLFDLLDTDRDGRLSVRELRRLPGLIKMLDRDGDGKLSLSEIPRSYRAAFAQGPANAGGYGPRFVAFAPGMGGARPLPVRRAGPLWFRKMDRNRDGDVSRREFLGSDEEFKKIDTDGDGLISVEEAIAYDKRMRARKARKE